MSEKKITVIAVGCGDRATTYCEEGVYQLKTMKVVAAVDPEPMRLQYMQERFGVFPENCYRSIHDLLPKGRIADLVINGTMDQYHMETAIPFLEQGYDMMLEKPVVNNAADMLRIREVAKEHNCRLVICHVLRYAPFYRKAKELIDSGMLGRIMNIQTSERVGAFHSSVAYLRGKWNSEAVCGSSLLLAKCCHDIDMLCWLNNASTPISVISNGGRNFFNPENAPKGSGTRCLVDCPDDIRKQCIYDVKSMYLDNCQIPWYPWQTTGKDWRSITYAEKVESLMTDNPHGQCIYKAGGDLVDHQNVLITFADGSTAVHNLTLGAMRPGRNLWVQGTEGELEGWVADGKLCLRKYDEKTSKYTEEFFSFNDLQGETGGHFGGDRGLVKDVCDLLTTGKTSVSYSSIDDTVNGHLVCYAADKSMRDNSIVTIETTV